MLEFLYETIPGRIILKLLVHPKLSEICGRFLDTSFSKILIKPFVKKNNIDLSMFYSEGFDCFNDCFARTIRPGYRNFDRNPKAFCAPCDGLLSVYPISKGVVIPVKGSRYSIARLLHSRKLAVQFEGGYCLVYRLCVNHYHRYSYFDNGVKGKNHFIPGVLHTVRPVALYNYPVFVENSREFTVMKTENFGKVVQMEVGAMLVGKISNNHGACDFTKGQEKGCFLYGGSTIIVLVKEDKVVIREKILNNTCNSVETPVKMGEAVGMAYGDI